MLIYTRHEKNVETNQEEKNELEKEHTSVSQELKDMKILLWSKQLVPYK